jgi:hypothetical protein
MDLDALQEFKSAGRTRFVPVSFDYADFHGKCVVVTSDTVVSLTVVENMKDPRQALDRWTLMLL